MIAPAWEKLKSYSVLFIRSHKRNRFKRYFFSLLTASVVVGIQLTVHAVLSEYTYHLLPLVIVLSAWYGGLGPGLLATLLVFILDTFFFLLPGVSYFDKDNLISSAILVIVGIIISFLSQASQEADRQKDDFIGFAGHELKNPLSTVQAYSEFIQRKRAKLPAKKIEKIAATIEEQTKRATLLINELLESTQLQAGKLSINEECFPLYDLVKTTVVNQRMIHPTRMIILKGRTQKKVIADRYRISQVLINLITNAVKYSPQAKKIIIHIENKQGEAVISVQDFGKGISRENNAKIFNPYFRERGEMTGDVEGLGLGLYISREIVRRHNGRLWVESTEGKGSTFYCSLPTV